MKISTRYIITALNSDRWHVAPAYSLATSTDMDTDFILTQTNIEYFLLTNFNK